MKSKKISLDKEFVIDENLKNEIFAKFQNCPNASARERFEFVTYYHAKFKTPITVLCNSLDVSRSAYYEHLKHKDDKSNYDAKIIEAIRLIQEENSYRLGVDKIRELLISNYSHLLKKDSIARNKVYRLMRKNNLTRKIQYNKFL